MMLDQIKDQIILTLKKDGFSVSESKTLIIATKNENVLHIRSPEEVRRSFNYKHIVQKATTNKIGGIHVDELKKLIQESVNKKVKDCVEFFCDKLNWSVLFSSSTMLEGKEVAYAEIITDTKKVFTIVFFNPDKKINFFVLEMNHREFINLVESIRITDLQSIAPSFYQLMKSF